MDSCRKIMLLTVLSAMLIAVSRTFAATPFQREPLVLENEYVSVSFDPKTGAMTSLVDKTSGWNILEREELGQSFELLLPMDGPEFTDEDCGYNVVKGIEQGAPEVEYYGDSIAFTWRRLKTSNMKTEADVVFRGAVSLTERGLEFTGDVVNNSDYIVEYVSWPCIGEVTVPDQKQFFLQSTRDDIRELFPHFNNQHGYWGVEWPTSTLMLTEKSFLQVNDNERGFLVFNREFPEHMTITSFELIPGLETRYTNPYASEIDGVPVRIQFKVNNCVYALPGEEKTLDPVTFVTYNGPWTAGVDLFKDLKGTYIAASGSASATPEWVISPLTWRRTGISGRADELMRVARESVAAGVDVLLTGGWCNISSGTPSVSPDLVKAIEECQAMGLKVVLETSWTKVNRHSPVYMEEYRCCIMSDPYGVPYNFEWLCPGSSHVREAVYAMWSGLPALKAADGYMNRDHNHDDRTFSCFDPDHDHSYGAPSVNGMMELDKVMEKALCEQEGKASFGYGFLEWQNSLYDGYMLDVPEDMYPRHRYVSPDEPMLVKVDVRNARRLMNKAILYRMNIVYDLNFYNSRLSDYPHITEYGRMVEDFRNAYADRIWDAAWQEHKGASVRGHDIEWSVFRDRDGKLSVVLANMNEDNESEVFVSFEKPGELLAVSPENTNPVPFKGKVSVAPLSAVVIFEE